MNINDQYKFIFDNLKDPREFKILSHIYKKHGPEAGIKSLLGPDLKAKTAYDAYSENEIAYNGETETIAYIVRTPANTQVYDSISKVHTIFNDINPEQKPYILIATEIFTTHTVNGRPRPVTNYNDRLFTTQLLLSDQTFETEEAMSVNKVIDFYTPMHEGIANRIPVNCWLGPELHEIQNNAYIFPEFSAWFKLNNPCTTDMYQEGQFIQNGEIIKQSNDTYPLSPTFTFIFWNTLKNEMHLATLPEPYTAITNKTYTKNATYNNGKKLHFICTRVSWTDQIQYPEINTFQSLDITLLNLNNKDSPVSKWLKSIKV